MNKRLNLKTIADVAELARLENHRLRQIAKAVVTGVGAEGAGSGGSGPGGPPKKPPSKAEAAVEVFSGEEHRSVKKSASDDICVSFILCGNSQQVQIAGVLGLRSSLHEGVLVRIPKTTKSFDFEAKRRSRPASSQVGFRSALFSRVFFGDSWASRH